MPRLFINDKTNIKNQVLRLKSEEYNYLKNVLRLKPGDELELVIAAKNILTVQIITISRETLNYKKIAENPVLANNLPYLTLTQCLPKQDKFAEILKKCTEIGVADFIPLISERTVPQFTESKSNHKIERWQNVLFSAAGQSRQNAVPKLWPIQNSLKEFLAWPQLKDYQLKLAFWEEKEIYLLKPMLRNWCSKNLIGLKKINDIKICIFIGPEGGLTHKEIGLLNQSGFHAVSLGPTVLRVENAGLVAAANVLYEFSHC